MILALFEDAGFILTGYIVTFLAGGALAWRVIRSGRNLAKQIPDDEKYWT